MGIVILMANIVQSYFIHSDMIHLNQSIEILTGGVYAGSSSWDKHRTEIDNCLKIYLLTSGELSLYDGEQEFLLEKGKLYFINGNKLSSQSCHGSFSTIWLHFMPKDLIVCHGLYAAPLVVEIPQEIDCSHRVLENIDLFISNNFPSYKEYYLEALKMQTFLQTIVIWLLEKFPWGEVDKTVNIRRIEPAIQYINNHFTEEIRLSDLAKECCMSINYFHKLFTNTLFTTPVHYILLLRMNTALQLLVNNEYNIKEIAYQLGFNDDAYFSRVFRKFYGITPGEYKRKRRELLF